MDYHAWIRSGDDILRMPADGYAFTDMEENGHTLKKNLIFYIIISMSLQLNALYVIAVDT